MNERIKIWLPSFTLVLLALAAGIAWRAELELRSGWEGLAWLEFFHWAVPLSVAAFIAWVACVARVRHPGAFVFALANLAAVGHVAAQMAIQLVFGLFFFFENLWAGLLIWSLIPVSFCLLCRLFGAPITLSRTVCSAVLFTTSWPVAVFAREFFEQRGSSDLIHAFKSGFVVAAQEFFCKFSECQEEGGMDGFISR